jgi:FkbM family methyltransferase
MENVSNKKKYCAQVCEENHKCFCEMERMPDHKTQQWVSLLSSNKGLKSIRNVVLRNKGILRQVTVSVKWNNLVSFKFYAPLKIAEKAKNRGIENTLLRNSISLLKTEKKDAIVFDVGANYGFLSTVWAKSVCSEGRKVFSFEPHPQVAASLQKTIHLNALEESVILSNVAVGKNPGFIKMFLYGTTSNVTAREVKPQAIGEVKQITLDSFTQEYGITCCDLIKIDTDGSEMQVLQGARNVIQKFKPLIVVETNGCKAVLDLLAQLNYTLLDMNLKKITGKEIPPNVFAVSN